MSLFNDMYDGIIDGMKEPEKETTEGKVPDESDKEDTKIKKLTEDEAVVKAGDRVTSSDGTKKGAVIALVKDDPSIGIVKWDDVEAEIPVPLANLKVEETKIKEDFAEEHGLGKADKEVEPSKEVGAEKDAKAVEPTPEPKKEETPTITKEYVGKSEDTHFYLISKDAATGEREDLQVVDQEGIMKFSAKANNLDMNKADDFIISAIKDVEIDQIERSIFVKYLLPRLEKEDVAEEPEIEKEEGVEELKPKAEKEPEEEAEEKPNESKKVNEETKSFEIYFKDLNDDAQKRLLDEFETAGEEENWEDSPIAIVDREMEEGKVPAESDKEDTKIKKLIETKITDDEGNEFEVSLVDDGTEDTVIDINGREFRFSDDFAGLWKDETGCLTDEGLKELALDALANLENDVYNELVGIGKAQVAAEKESEEEGGVVGEDKTAEVKVDESYGNVSIKADIESGLSKEEIIKKIQDRYPDIKIEQAEEIYNGVKNGTAIDWTHKTTKVKENKQLKEAELTDEKCPDCGKFLTKYVGQKTGRITLKCSNCGNELHPEEKVEEPKKETTEGKVPDPKDDETTTNKKLTEGLEIGKTYTGIELEDLGYDIDVDMTDEEGRLFIAYPPEDVGDKYSVIDAGNDNYRVLKVLEVKESKKDLLSELLDLDKD